MNYDFLVSTKQQNISNKIDEYLDYLVIQCLQTPTVLNMTQDQKDQFIVTIRNHFNQVILETLVDRLNAEQFSQIEYLDPTSSEMVEMVQKLASKTPGLMSDIQIRLQKEVEYIQQTSKLPDQSLI